MNSIFAWSLISVKSLETTDLISDNQIECYKINASNELIFNRNNHLFISWTYRKEFRFSLIINLFNMNIGSNYFLTSPARSKYICIKYLQKYAILYKNYQIFWDLYNDFTFSLRKFKVDKLLRENLNKSHTRI